MVLTVTARENFYKRILDLEWEESYLEGAQWALASTVNKEVDTDLYQAGIDLAVKKSEPYNWSALSYERDMAFGFDQAGLRGEAESFEEAKQMAIEAAYKVAVAHINELWEGIPFAESVRTIRPPAIKGWASGNAERLYHVMATLSDLGIQSEDTAFEYARILHTFINGPIETVEQATRDLYTVCKTLHEARVPMADYFDSISAATSVLNEQYPDLTSTEVYGILAKKDTGFFEEMVD